MYETSGLALLSADGQPIAYTVAGLAEDSQVTEVVIPDKHNGLPVVGIDEGAFEGNTNITSVIMTESIVSVGANAFGGCIALETIECADFYQSQDWDSAWCGDRVTVMLKAPKAGDKTPYDVYLEAMNATQHNLNRYIMTTSSIAYMSDGVRREKMLEVTSEQRQYYDDCYYTTSEIDYGSGSSIPVTSSVYYIGGYYYNVQASQKFQMSKEAWNDMMTVNRDDMPELTARYFKQVEFMMSTSGSMYLSMTLDAEYLRLIMIEELGPEAATLQLSDTVYNYTFTSDGLLQSYTSDTSMSMGEGYTMDAHSEVRFSQVNTYTGPSAPYGYMDVTSTLQDYYCKYGHTAVECEQVDATCFGDGWTAYSYCSRCFQAIVEAQTIKASHNYENGECTECGAFEEARSTGLAYELNEDGTGYILVGIGDCRDITIIVPEYVYGRPVIEINADAFEGTDVIEIYVGDEHYSIEEFSGWEIQENPVEN